MASSALISVKKALLAALQANEDLDGVQREYGYPAKDELVQAELVFLGRGRFDHDPGPMKPGRVFRNETGELDIIIDVKAVGGTPEFADERVIAIGQLVEEIVADNRNLGNDTANGITVGAVTMRRGDLTNAYNDRGSLSRLVYTLRFDARLT
jgi:hypothetical protein